MHNHGRQIVLSSDTPPSQIIGIKDRLKSRFGWGLIADIQAPTLETKIAILNQKAESMGIELPHEASVKIASTVDSNIRELEGALTML